MQSQSTSRSLSADPVLPGHRHPVAVFARYVQFFGGCVLVDVTLPYEDGSRLFNAGCLERGESRSLSSMGSDMLPTGSGGSYRYR